MLNFRFVWSAAVAAALVTPADFAHAVPSLVTDDTTVIQARPTESQTGWSFVQPGPGQLALMSFPMREVIGPATVDDIERVVLVFSVVTIQTAGSLEIVRLLAPFSEVSNPTFNTRPPASAAGTGVLFALDRGSTRPYTVDVTSLFKQSLAANQATFGVAIQPSTGTPSASASIWARESGIIVPWTPATRPLLDITLKSKSAPAPIDYLASSTGGSPCSNVCASGGGVSILTANGMVCRNWNGSDQTYEWYRSQAPYPGPPPGYWCGSQTPTAACYCRKF